MKTKIFLFLIFIIIAIVAAFVFLNPTKVPLYITPSDKFNLPVSIVILASIVMGFIFMLIISIFRELKMVMDMRKYKKLISNVEKGKELFKNALLEFFKGNKKSAIKNLNNAIKLDENPAYFLTAKDIETENGKVEEVISKLPYEISRFYLIEYYFNTEKYATLINIANEILNETDIKNFKILSYIRDAFIKLEKFNEAAKIEDKILSLKGINKAKEIEKLAEIKYLEAKKGNSLEQVNNFIKKFPKFRPGYFLKYQLLEQENEKEAIRTLKEGYSNTGDISFLCEIINILEESSDEHILKFSEKIFLKIKDNKAELLLGIVYFLNNNLEKSEQIVKKYLKDEKLSKLASLLYAEVLYRKDMNLKDVIELFRKVLDTQAGIHLKFYCTKCNKKFKKWSDYCPNCNSFDSIYSIFNKGEDNGF